ncbi:acyl carrier protein [Fulvivirga lutimaris]|uniref:acyl carrier protein n=1 Tax=Fulvivirga lutimaris TaxID=1819566 RepID=UPI0012BD16A2|nr:acyl carrier protein [Fulvivirga lutimaris]MTI38066.1 acyl carrier protein [Fulvivirga lutimaris]
MEVENTQQIIEVLKRLIANEQNLPLANIQDQSSFFDLGLDSISAVYLMELAENELNVKLTPLDFWDYPTIEQFAKNIFNQNFKR